MGPIDDIRFKGLPLPAGMPVTRIGDLGWNALRDLEYPALVLHEEQLVHNIITMADYCRHHGVELAPHAKTSLSPQLIRRQMEAGAWGATAATAAQVRGLLAIGVPRILLANLLVDPVAIRWIVTHVLGEKDTGFSCYVDSVGVGRAAGSGMRPSRSGRPARRAPGGGIRRRSHRCEKPRGGPRRGAGGQPVRAPAPRRRGWL